MYRVELRRLAQRGLERLPKSDFQSVSEAIADLAGTPRPRGIEKVRGTDLWRIRQGDYRIVFEISDREQLVTVVRVGHRREIYREL